MKELLIILVLAVIIEKVLGIVKDLLGRKPQPRTMRLAALFLAVALTVTTRTGILHALGVLPGDANSAHFLIDWLLTGVIIGRGSNVMHDIFAVLEKANKALGTRL